MACCLLLIPLFPVAFGLTHPPKVGELHPPFSRFAVVRKSLRLNKGGLLQRLFSTFANGWPGRGLLLLRLLTAAVLLNCAIAHLGQAIPLTSTVLRMIGAGTGIFIFAGLWTPVAGTLIAVLEIWIAFFFAATPLVHIMLATLGATLAMIGPGAWSLDARLFGRKRIAAPKA